MARLARTMRAAFRRKSVALAGVALIIVAFGLIQTARPDAPEFSGLDSALIDLEERVRTEPQNAEARLAVALAYGERGLYARAAEQFDQVLVLQKDNQVALGGLGKVRFELKDYAAAEAALKRIVELNAGNERRLAIDQLQEAQYFLAMTYVAQNKNDEAAAAVRDALTMKASDADSWRVLGDIEKRRGDHAAAEQAYMSALAYVPNYTEVYRSLDGVYSSMKRDGARQWAQGMVMLSERTPDKAVKRLESAVRAEPTFAVAHQGLAMAYESTGRREDAVNSYRRALEISPELFLSRDALLRLEPPTGSQPAGAR